MRKLIFILGMMLLPLAGASPFATETPYLIIEQEAPIKPFEALWEATCIVESANDSLAYNEREEATGISQIRPIRLLDYNQRTGKNYTMEQMYSPTISKEIYMYYASKYNPSDLETIARRWNGSGEMTTNYWNKIKTHL